MFTTVATLGIAIRNARKRKTDDLIGDNLTHRLLLRILVLDASCRSTDDAENKFRGLIFTVGNKVRKL